MNIDGVNVVTDNPGVGDILCHDENRKYKFIQLDTFQAGTFPAAWETLGVVVLRKGNTVTVCSKHNETKKFMEVFPYIVTGQTLDGAEHTATLRLHGKPSTSTYYDFTYSANTEEEFVVQLKQFLSRNGETDWSAYMQDGKVILQYDNYTSAESSTTTAVTGLTLTSRLSIDLQKNQPSFLRKCGNYGNGIWSVNGIVQVFQKDRTETAFNPNEDVTSVPSYPICYPAFCGTSEHRDKDYCLWLRQQYCADPAHPTLDDWKRYLGDITHVIPCMVGGNSPKLRDGKAITDRLKNVVYQAQDGSMKKLYTGAVWCSEFLDGKGYMITTAEMDEAFGDVTYGMSGVARDEADPINRSLFAIGGDFISVTSAYNFPHLITHYTIRTSYSGYYDNAYANSALRVIPLARIELPVDR